MFQVVTEKFYLVIWRCAATTMAALEARAKRAGNLPTGRRVPSLTVSHIYPRLEDIQVEISERSGSIQAKFMKTVVISSF